MLPHNLIPDQRPQFWIRIMAVRFFILETMKGKVTKL